MMSSRNQPRLGEVALRLSHIVRERPGIHFRALGRAAGVTSVGQLRHHIDRLERGGLVVELSEGRFKRFFATNDHDANLRPVLARFARKVPRQVGKLLLVRSMNRTQLQHAIGLADSTLGYHLARMVRFGDLVKNPGRNCCLYALANPDLIRRIFTMPSPHPEPVGPIAAIAVPEAPAAPVGPMLAQPEATPIAASAAFETITVPGPSTFDHISNVTAPAPLASNGT